MSAIKQTTLRIPTDLYEVIKNRAKFNHRACNQEVVFLLEAGLAESSQFARDFLLMMKKAKDKA